MCDRAFTKQIRYGCQGSPSYIFLPLHGLHSCVNLREFRKEARMILPEVTTVAVLYMLWKHRGSQLKGGEEKFWLK